MLDSLTNHRRAREKLAEITHSVKEDDTSVTLSFTGFEALTKHDVKVVKKERGWLGTITLSEGCIEFFLSNRGLQVASRIELKKEEKVHDTKAPDAKNVERMYYSSSLQAGASRAEFFSKPVDLSTLKAEPITVNEFTLTVQKQKEEVLPLS